MTVVWRGAVGCTSDS